MAILPGRWTRPTKMPSSNEVRSHLCILVMDPNVQFFHVIPLLFFACFHPRPGWKSFGHALPPTKSCKITPSKIIPGTQPRNTVLNTSHSHSANKNKRSLCAERSLCAKKPVLLVCSTNSKPMTSREMNSNATTTKTNTTHLYHLKIKAGMVILLSYKCQSFLSIQGE